MLSVATNFQDGSARNAHKEPISIEDIASSISLIAPHIRMALIASNVKQATLCQK